MKKRFTDNWCKDYNVEQFNATANYHFAVPILLQLKCVSSSKQSYFWPVLRSFPAASFPGSFFCSKIMSTRFEIAVTFIKCQLMHIRRCVMSTISLHVCVCGYAHAEEMENIASWYKLEHCYLFLLSTETWLNFPHTRKHALTRTHTCCPAHFAVTIAAWGIRKWLCSSLHILASKIRLAQGRSTVRWLPLSTLCGNSRTLFSVHLSVWHHSEKASRPISSCLPAVWFHLHGNCDTI